MPNNSVKYAVVTGASGGIGRIITRKLLEKDYTVFATARSAGNIPATGLAADAAARFIPMELDLTEEGSILHLVDEIETRTRGAGISALINNAGIIVEGPLDLILVEDFRLQFDVNVAGPFALTGALLPQLRIGKGRVVNIGAASAHTTVPFFGAISASKAALASLSDAMRMEFAPLGIDVILIEPGAIDTDILKSSAALQCEALARQNPGKVALYRSAMDAMNKAMAKSAVDKPDVVADAVVRSLLARRPKPRQLVGKGASQLAILRKLPTRLRDHILTGSLGIASALRAAVAAEAKS